MINSGMMICSFYLKERFRRNQEIFYPLNHEYQAKEDPQVYADVFDMMRAFCEANYSFSDDEKNRKMFSVGTDSIVLYDESTYRAMSFTIRSGAYGIESDMTDRRTKEVKYRRKSDDADIKDFKCLMFVPKDEGEVEVTKGIFIFQTVATYGVKTISTKQMRAFFAGLGLTLETRSVSIRAFVEKLVEQGDLYKVTLIKDRLSPNHADNMLISTGREERSYIKPQLQPVWFQKLMLFFDRASKTTIYEIDGEIFDDIKVEFKLGSKYRTVGLKFIDKLSVVEDVPDTIYKDGRFKEETLIKHMIETAIAYKEKMVMSEGQ